GDARRTEVDGGPPERSLQCAPKMFPPWVSVPLRVSVVKMKRPPNGGLSYSRSGAGLLLRRDGRREAGLHPGPVAAVDQVLPPGAIEERARRGERLLGLGLGRRRPDLLHGGAELGTLRAIAGGGGLVLTKRLLGGLDARH